MRALARQPSDDKRQSVTWKRGVIKCRGIPPAFSLPREVSHEGALGSKTKRGLILLFFDKLETLQAYDIVKIYYDAGQGMVTDALHAAFEYVPSKQGLPAGTVVPRTSGPADSGLYLRDRVGRISMKLTRPVELRDVHFEKNNPPARPIALRQEAPMKRYVLMALGFICFGLGMIGVFIPVLPTTPFLLLAAFLFSRSSERMDAWIRSTRVWQSYGQPFGDSGGIARRKKFHIVGISYLMLGVSALLMQKPIVWGILAAVALFLAWLMIFHIPTVEEDDVAKFVDPKPEIESIGQTIAEHHEQAATTNTGKIVVRQVVE